MKKRMPLVLAFCQTPYQQTKFTTCKIQKFLLGTFCHFIEQIVRVGPNKKIMENFLFGVMGSTFADDGIPGVHHHGHAGPSEFVVASAVVEDAGCSPPTCCDVEASISRNCRKGGRGSIGGAGWSDGWLPSSSP
jgi:hypothetical protein